MTISQYNPLAGVIPASGVEEVQVPDALPFVAPSASLSNGTPAVFADSTGEVLRAVVAPVTHTTPTLVLSATNDQSHVIVDMAAIGAGLVVSILDTLRPGFGCTLRKSGAANDITFAAGAGLITPTFRGQLTITADDTDVFIFVESSTKAMVYVVEPA